MDKIIRQCAGIDTSKDDLAATFSVIKDDLGVAHLSSKVFSNDLAGFRELLKWAGPLENTGLPLAFVMEATGVYHEKLAAFLFDAGRKVSVVLPKRAKDFSKTMKVKTITDKVASQYLAVMGLEKKLDLWSKPEPVYIQLRRLTREKSQIQDNITQLKNEKHAERAGAWPNTRTLQRQSELLKILARQKKDVEKDIDVLLGEHKQLKEKVRKIMTIPGVGKATAVSVIAETHGFAQVTSRRQLVSYAGYDVINHESGTSVKKKPRISKRGNRHIRATMHMPALTAIKHNPKQKATFARIVSTSGIKMKGVVAVQRKLLVLIYTLWKNETEFDPEFEQKEKGQLKATLNELDQVRSL